MILADKLIQLRKKSGMSQEELAEKMNVSRQAVSKWEGAQSIPDLEKILQLSELYGVTTDYLLKDEMESEEFVGKDEPTVRKVTLEQANEYLSLSKTASVRIAFGVFLCILSVIPLIILGGTTTMTPPLLSENTAGVIGMAFMLVLVAIAVGIFIYTGSQREKYEFLEKEPFDTEYGVTGAVKERQKEYRPTYIKLNIIGTVLCVLSPIALFAGAFDEKNEFFITIMLGVMLLVAGAGTFCFILAGVKNAAMEKLLKTGEYSPKNKPSPFKNAVSTIYWLTATAAALLWMFLDNSKNSYFWVVFPVAGVLFPAVLGICSLIENKKK